jgi:hypothetical protein
MIRQAQVDSDLALTFFSTPWEELFLCTFCDAAWAVHPDGSSQGGFVTLLAPQSFRQGKATECSVLDYRSWKLRRVCRSSLSAESQALTDALDLQEFARVFKLELESAEGLDLRKSDIHVSKSTRACVVLDCKSLYDALARVESCGLNLAEKRTAIEVLAAKQRTQEIGIDVMWVNSDRQLADGLTKPALSGALVKFMRHQSWKLVHDPTFTSAKKVRAQTRKGGHK